jgi:hypothetical protein
VEASWNVRINALELNGHLLVRLVHAASVLSIAEMQQAGV